ncbi:MAG: hypothetical protein V7641_4566 [Blastocatellia bacterium]
MKAILRDRFATLEGYDQATGLASRYRAAGLLRRQQHRRAVSLSPLKQFPHKRMWENAIPQANRNRIQDSGFRIQDGHTL